MRNILFTSVVLLIFFCFDTNAQAVFQKIFGATGYDFYGRSMQKTSDGGYVMTGVREDFTGSSISNISLMKINVNGNLIWAKTYGGPGYEEGNCVRQTNDGGYIIAGNASGGFGTGGSDIYLVKTDSIGALLWSRTFGGTLDDFANSVVQTADGGYLVAGLTRSFGAGNEDIYLIKTNSSGNLVWTKVIGSVGRDWINSVQNTNDGKFILTGRILTSLIANNDDLCLMKMDTSGNILWLKSFSAGNDDTEGYAVRQTNDAGFIITGSFGNILFFSTDIYLLKTDSAGNVQWSKTLSDINNDRGLSVEQTNDGGYIVGGSTNPTATNGFLIRTNSTGNILWSKSYGGNNNDACSNVHQAIDGGYISCGMTQNFALGDGSFYLVKTDSNGVSNCNESNITYLVSNPVTQVMIPSYTIATGGISGIPATLTTSGGAATVLCNSSVGLPEESQDEFGITISPNPSNGKFKMSFANMVTQGNVEIKNILGKNIFSATIYKESKKEIHLKNISSGIYFVKVNDGENYFCKKIIIEQE